MQDLDLGSSQEGGNDESMVDLLRVSAKKERQFSALLFFRLQEPLHALIKTERVTLLGLLDQKLDHMALEALERLGVGELVGVGEEDELDEQVLLVSKQCGCGLGEINNRHARPDPRPASQRQSYQRELPEQSEPRQRHLLRSESALLSNSDQALAEMIQR